MKIQSTGSNFDFEEVPCERTATLSEKDIMHVRKTLLDIDANGKWSGPYRRYRSPRVTVVYVLLVNF